MRVKELIEELKKFDPNAHVVVGETVVSAVEQIVGRYQYQIMMMNPKFVVSDRGHDKAVMFLVHTEFSDGVVGLTRYYSCS